MTELVLIMETRSSNRSDYMYIKSTIDYYYEPRTFAIKPIYAGTKPELIKQDKKISKERLNTGRTLKVIICADYDREELLNSEITDYCKKNTYELVWMNRNIEDVYLNKTVDNKNKKSEAINFQKKKDILFIQLKNLQEENPLHKKQSTNLLCVLDKYLKRKI